LNIRTGEEEDMMGGLEEKESTCDGLSDEDIGGQMLK
jgi:hypothetical protein